MTTYSVYLQLISAWESYLFNPQHDVAPRHDGE